MDKSIDKKIRKNLLLSAIIISIFVSLAASQDVEKVGTSAATFLRVPVGARAVAMGGAFVAQSNDVSALFWNPGGLARIDRYELLVDHSPWLPGLSFNYIALAIPLQGYGTMGLSVTSLGTQKMDVTTPDQPMGTGETFDAASVAVGLSFSRKLTDRFSLGATFKYVNERIFNSTATGFALDIGAVYDTPFEGIRFGFSVSNFGTKMQMTGDDLNLRVDIAPDQKGNNQSVVGQLKTDRFDMPLIMRVGLAWDALNSDFNRLTIAVDGLNPNDNGHSLNVGAEYALFNEQVLLRAGYNELFLDEPEKGLTLGAGASLNVGGNIRLRAEYAYQQFIHLGDVNRYTLIVNF
ncbi:MAG TPA: PorV/PorQ family protein [Caldithrix abyssi]|uniref:PorV/PorQ family protein n=1 Tax=Caldithrix abyssi TaxID=187145 RepID=A0A7V4U367_CALAY|nr:PorV/PorQ family protein [Caldithrix abyssi]